MRHAPQTTNLPFCRSASPKDVHGCTWAKSSAPPRRAHVSREELDPSGQLRAIMAPPEPSRS
eukprot:2172222-Prymnesium_polylepis.1